MKYTTYLFLVLFTLSVTCTAAHGSRLADAVKSGNIKRVNQLIKQGADVNEKYELDHRRLHSPRTPLELAAESGNTDIARLLLKNGAKVNQTHDVQNDSGIIISTYVSSPSLFIAAIKGHLEMCRLLISYGASVDPTRNGKPDPYSLKKPLLEAAKSGNTDIASLLLKNGAKVNRIMIVDYRSTYVSSPSLSTAARHGHLEMCKLLISYGANINPTKSGKPDLYSYEKTLWVAAEGGHLEVCKFLIEKGANVNVERTIEGNWVQPVEKMSLLFYLKKASLSPEVINLLIENGAIEHRADI